MLYHIVSGGDILLPSCRFCQVTGVLFNPLEIFSFKILLLESSEAPGCRLH